MPRLKNRTHPKSLSYEQALALRTKFEAGGVTQTALALEYGISQPAVSAIVKGRVHKAPIMVMTKEEELEARRRQGFFLRYGITYEEWQTMLERAGHACEACRTPVADTPLNCDHDHATKRVRGVLCTNCNLALGHLGDSIDRILGLVRYLESRN